MLLIHGARSMIRIAAAKTPLLSQWVMRIANTRHKNVAGIALANKNRAHRFGNDYQRIS
jgi:hypothetical protein